MKPEEVIKLEEVRNHLAMVLVTNAYINICKSNDLVIAIDAIEKQVPKKPVMDSEKEGRWKYKCPNCGTLGVTEDYGAPNDYCSDCGQAILWEE